MNHTLEQKYPWGRARVALAVAVLGALCFLGLVNAGVRSSPTTSWLLAGPYGGRIYRLALDAFNPTTLYAGTDNGLFKTSDGGSNWQLIGFPGTPISTIEFDYNVAPKAIYLAPACTQVKRSVDDGQTWQDIHTGLPAVCIYRLAVDPVRGNHVWAATTGGVYRWSENDQQWLATAMISETKLVMARDGWVYAVTQHDILRSDNNGATWTSIFGDLPAETQITSILLSPTSSQILYIGTWYGGAFKTFDGGQHWISLYPQLPSFTQVDDLVSAPNNPSVLYAALYGYFDDNGNASGVYRSTDGGGSWSLVSTGLLNKYSHTLAVHPNSSSVVYVGTDGSGVFRSDDGGASWQQRTTGIANLEVKALLRVTNTLYAATALDGIYRSLDDGLSWERYNNGLPAVTLYANDLTVDGQGNLVGAFSRRGVLRLNAGTWVTVSDVLTHTEVQTILTVSGTLLIGALDPNSAEDTQILQSVDGGRTWTLQSAGLPTSSLKIHSLAVRTVGSQTFLLAATSKGIHRSALSPIIWEPANSGIATQDIYDIAVDPSNPDTLYAATNCAYIYKSPDGGTSWGQRSSGLTTSCIFSVLVNPADPTEVYAGTNSGVYRGIDGGAFWFKIMASSGETSLNDRTGALLALPDQSLLAGAASGTWKTAQAALPTPTPQPRIAWTAMVYLNGDNNLDYRTFQAFNRLEQAASNPNVRIVVLWDRLGWTNTREYLVQPDANPNALSPNYVLNANMWGWGELDMGQTETLRDFINRSRLRFPADHYFLAVVNHGGGWSPNLLPDQARTRWDYGGSGFSWDESNNYHYLSTSDMGEIFDQVAAAGGPLDVVFYDACLMAMSEEVYQVRDGMRYLIASENETWTSFPYNAYLTSLSSTTTPEQLATSIVDLYDASLVGYPRTMSLLDLSHAGTFSNSLDNLSQALVQSLPASHNVISAAYQATQKLDFNFDFILEDGEGYVDLRSFASELITRSLNLTVTQAAQNLVDLLDNSTTSLVRYERHQSNIAWPSNHFLDLNRASGLSIYLPLGLADNDLSYYLPDQLDLARDTHWDDFIFEYLGFYPQPGQLPTRGHQPIPGEATRWVYLPLVFAKY